MHLFATGSRDDYPLLIAVRLFIQRPNVAAP